MDNPRLWPMSPVAGLTMRDWFAGLAMQGMMAHGVRPGVSAREAAAAAYHRADAMMAERGDGRFTVPAGEDVAYPPAERYEEGN